MKHTPGKWEAVEVGVSDLENGVAICEVIADGRKLVCECAYEADAKLMAAAPELLDACEEALGALNGAECALPGYVVAALERAIAKATGEPQ